MNAEGTSTRRLEKAQGFAPLDKAVEARWKLVRVNTDFYGGSAQRRRSFQSDPQAGEFAGIN